MWGFPQTGAKKRPKYALLLVVIREAQANKLVTV